MRITFSSKCSFSSCNMSTCNAILILHDISNYSIPFYTNSKDITILKVQVPHLVNQKLNSGCQDLVISYYPNL